MAHNSHAKRPAGRTRPARATRSPRPAPTAAPVSPDADVVQSFELPTIRIPASELQDPAAAAERIWRTLAGSPMPILSNDEKRVLQAMHDIERGSRDQLSPAPADVLAWYLRGNVKSLERVVTGLRQRGLIEDASPRFMAKRIPIKDSPFWSPAFGLLRSGVHHLPGGTICMRVLKVSERVGNPDQSVVWSTSLWDVSGAGSFLRDQSDPAHDKERVELLSAMMADDGLAELSKRREWVQPVRHRWNGPELLLTLTPAGIATAERCSSVCDRLQIDKLSGVVALDGESGIVQSAPALDFLLALKEAGAKGVTSRELKQRSLDRFRVFGTHFPAWLMSHIERPAERQRGGVYRFAE